ncbi:SGNH/GDSL hydrolase family protein [Bacillus sp. IITD106]|nr:SGNH/GDSL hydrolase family protein [Bacillus sp. IITD106]
MRAIFVTVATVLCFVFLAFGHFYWKEKTSISSFNSAEKLINEKGSKVESKETVDLEESKIVDVKILNYIRNWPSNAQKAFEKALENGETYKLAIVGSPALGKETGGWSAMLKDILVDTYGENNLQVEIFEYALSSDQFIAGGHDQEVIDFKPDFILLEPFKWIDNSAAPQHNSGNILKFIDAFDETGSNAVLVLQPPPPVYDTRYYPVQIEELKELAKEHGLDYLDHWSAWPNHNNPELEEYLLEDDSAPNEKGHQVWFEFLKEYFIGKSV